MPETQGEKEGACVAYGIKKRGGTPRIMKNMSLKKLRQWCTSPVKKDDIEPRLRSPELREQATSPFEKRIDELLKGI